MPFGIQPIHLVVLAVVALLIFGPSRLPEIGRGMGKAMTEFRHSFREMNESLVQEVQKSEVGQAVSDPLSTNRVKSGSTLAIPCPQCGATNPKQARFCNSCGTKLTE